MKKYISQKKFIAIIFFILIITIFLTIILVQNYNTKDLKLSSDDNRYYVVTVTDDSKYVCFR